MKAQDEARLKKRYVALDIHKYYVLVGAMTADKQWVVRPRKVRTAQVESWCRRYLLPSDEVVLESTSNAWTLYDILAPLVARVLVANPLKVGQIALARVKTDRLDLERLLILLIADLVPEVWVPPMPVRELRGLISHRRRLGKHVVMTKNRLQSVVHRLNLAAPEGPIFGTSNRGWWQQARFSRILQLQIDQDLHLLEELMELKETVERELAILSNREPWADQAVYLMQLPGMGYILTMTVLSAIGDITRFPDAKKLGGYAGLGAGVYLSGQKQQDKKITKAGRKELRWAWVEAARTAVRLDPFWQAKYMRLCVRMPKHKALVAVARQKLVVGWHVLTKKEARRESTPERLGYKMLRWAWVLDVEALAGMTRQQFAKYGLLRLGVGQALTWVVGGGRRRGIASAEEVLALKPGWLPPG